MEEYIITINDVKEAYKKLKAYIYNSNNSDILFRRELAIYEDEKIDEKLENFTNSINKAISLNEDDLKEFLIQSFNDINYYILPKKIPNTSDQTTCDNIFRNDSDEFLEEKNLEENNINYFFKAQLEYLLIDVLWIIKEGYHLINDEIRKNCYGNTLCYDAETKSIKKGERLFDNYAYKYQAWRDNGIRIAKQQIKNKNNVLLICLDFERFFPSSNICFDKIKTDIKEKNEQKCHLTKILECIYKAYNDKIQKESQRIQLPIGLFSSRVIANWYLSNFDTSMKKHFMPIYYGRYVDDIFMVISNITLDQNENVQNWFEEKFINNEKSPIHKSKDLNNSYVYNDDEKLKFNKDKVKFFFFSTDYSTALLDNFQKQIEENSSAFWLLPEENDDNTFEENAYNIDYEDTINKFRAISGIRNNKYGASIFLSKIIKQTILSSNEKNNKMTQSIFKFFSGKNFIEMNSLWEKAYTYFVATEDKVSIKKFYNKINNYINLLRYNNTDDTRILQDSLKVINSFSLSMATSLNYSIFPENEISIVDIDNFSVIEMAKKIRKSYLSRRQYMPLPLIIYSKNCPENIIEKNIIEKCLKTNIEYDESIINSYKNPRLIRSYEKLIFNFFNILFKSANENSNPHEEYKKLINKIVYKTDDVKTDNSKTKIDTIEFHTISPNENQMKIGLSNIKLIYKDIINAMKGNSNNNWTKLQRHNRLLNLATREKVNCFVLPETSVPWAFINMYAEHALKKRQMIIFGLEHILINNYCYNFSVVLLPFTNSKGVDDVLPIFRLKNHYSPIEQKEILKYHNKIPQLSPQLYHLIKWHGITFTVFNCYELADINHRALFKSKIDILFAIEYNKDIPYFKNIVESTCRDLHCYFVQANTSEYGDSQISIPKKTIEMTPLKVKGGENDTILTYNLDIDKLRDFQKQNVLFQDPEEFKNTPPGFDHENVDNR